MSEFCPYWPYMMTPPRYLSLLDRIDSLEDRNLKLRKELDNLKRSSSPILSRDYSSKSKSKQSDDLDSKPQRGGAGKLSRPAYTDFLPENRYSYPTPAFFPVAACDHPPLTRKKLPDWQTRDRTPTPLAPAEHQAVRPARSKTPVPTSKGLLSPQQSSSFRASSPRGTPSSFERDMPQSSSPKSSRKEKKNFMKSERREFDDFIEIDTYRESEPNVPCCRTLVPSPHPMNPKVPLMPTPGLDNEMDNWMKNSTRLLKVTGGDQSGVRACSPWKTFGDGSDDQQFAKLAGLSALHSNAIDQLKACY